MSRELTEGPPQPPERFSALIARARPAALGDAAAEQLARYLSELDAWRRKINLTGRLSPEDLVAHALEAVTGSALIADDAEVVDIGSGAGFPAIPLAILKPDASFTLVEPVAKKAAFLRHVARALPLSNVAVRAARIEEVGGQTFDAATTRAVGALGTLIGPAGFLKPKGRLLAWTTDPEGAARELPRLRLSQAVPIPGSRAKTIAVFVKLD
jgi:16S rRNA (guanine527-N7)-methyltransferase